MIKRFRFMTCALSMAAILVAVPPAHAQKKYDTGATDTSIKIGNLMPYSGPASAYSVIGKVEEAYFKMVNEKGGINGRKIEFVTYDDAYSPPKTAEQARRLVESDEVLLLFSTLGAPTNSAIHRYMNTKKVPQLFVASGSTKWGDPKNFPWTMGAWPSYQSEGRIYAKYILDTKPNAKIAILYQNDDFGKDVLKGLKDGLGEKTSLIVAEASYETSDPVIDSQIIKLKTSGADVFVNLSTPKFAAQSIRKVAEIQWQPMHIVSAISNSVGSVIKPAGFDNAKGVISAQFLKDPSDPVWKADAGLKELNTFLDKYYPEADRANSLVGYGYVNAQMMFQTLKQAGDNLTRDNIMKQAASLKNMELPMLLPGIKVNTAADDFNPIEQMQLMRFNGEHWELFGPVIEGAVRN